MYDIAVIGGGLAGLINAILLSRSGKNVILFEKKAYPFHRVCGEYISNEVRPFLQRNDLYPFEFDLPNIKRLSLTSVNGRQAEMDLNLGGFGISRLTFDAYLARKAREAGVEIFEKTAISKVEFKNDQFFLQANTQSYQAKLVIGAQGKRSTLDAAMNRPFMNRKSPYVGVKYHVKTDLPTDLISLHNFQDGYCGVSRVEDDTYNLCYLSHRDNLKNHGDIGTMEKEVLFRNPFLKSLFESSDFLLYKPVVINEITFDKKTLVHEHLLMSGDAAGMITPLCGNGMAMAIHSAEILSGLIVKYWNQGEPDRALLEAAYQQTWNRHFSKRLWAGRKIQHLFGSVAASNLAVSLAGIKPIANQLIKLTHGKPF